MQEDNLETHQERLDRLRKLSENSSGKAELKSKRSIRRALMKSRKQAAKKAEGLQEQSKQGHYNPSPI